MDIIVAVQNRDPALPIGFARLPGEAYCDKQRIANHSRRSGRYSLDQAARGPCASRERADRAWEYARARPLRTEASVDFGLGSVD